MFPVAHCRDNGTTALVALREEDWFALLRRLEASPNRAETVSASAHLAAVDAALDAALGPSPSIETSRGDRIRALASRAAPRRLDGVSIEATAGGRIVFRPAQPK